MTIERGIDAFKNLNDLGFVEFATGLVSGVYDTVVSGQLEQLQAYSELVSAVSGSVEEFVLNTTGLNTSAGATGNSAAIDDYIVDVLGLDLADAPFDTATGAGDDLYELFVDQFGAAAMAAHPQGASSKISLAELQSLVFDKLVADANQQYNLLTEIIRIGYARLDADSVEVKAALDFNISASETDVRNSYKTKVKSVQRTRNKDVGLSLKFLKFQSNRGYARNRLKVKTVSKSAASSINMSAQATGYVRVQFSTTTFDTEMAQVQ